MKAELKFPENVKTFKRKHFIDQKNGNVNIVARKREANSNSSDVDYKIGEIRVEKLFRKFHPDTKKIVWPGLESLEPERLKIICDEVLEQVRKKELSGFIKDYNYKHVNASELQTSRVIKNARFFSFLNAREERLTVAACIYDKITFYLVRADNNNVFRLTKDSADIYALKSGLHPVHFS